MKNQNSRPDPKFPIEDVYSALYKWPSYKVIQNILKDYPELKIYLAGGAIKNVVWGEEYIKDFDFFLDYEDKNEIIERLLEHGEIKYGPFGAPRWYPNGENIFYCDFVWIRKFYNGLWYCKDIVDVINQFDFTANAIAIDIRTGDVYNHQNALHDIHDRILRAIRFDYPNELITPSHNISRLEVLWFRLSHYAKKYNMKIEPITYAWLEEHKDFYTKRKIFSELFFEPNI